jgi:hypothetical protein
MLGQVRGEIPGVPTTADLAHPGGQLRDGPVQQLRGVRAGILVRLHQVRGQGDLRVGPERDVRPVRPLTLVVVHRVLLLAAVDLHVGGVPVDRDRRQQPGASPPGQQSQPPAADHPDAVLDPGQMRWGEPLRQLPGGGGRRRGYRLQQLPGRVRPPPVHPDQEVLTGQLRTRHRQQQAAPGHPAATFLDRADRGVQRLPDAQHPIQFGHRGQPGMTGQPDIRRREPDPATEPATTRGPPSRCKNR